MLLLVKRKTAKMCIQIYVYVFPLFDQELFLFGLWPRFCPFIRMLGFLCLYC